MIFRMESQRHILLKLDRDISNLIGTKSHGNFNEFDDENFRAISNNIPEWKSD